MTEKMYDLANNTLGKIQKPELERLARMTVVCFETSTVGIWLVNLNFLFDTILGHSGPRLLSYCHVQGVQLLSKIGILGQKDLEIGNSYQQIKIIKYTA